MDPEFSLDTFGGIFALVQFLQEHHQILVLDTETWLYVQVIFVQKHTYTVSFKLNLKDTTARQIL